MDADQLFTRQSPAARAPTLRGVPQQHSFVMFYMVCLQTEDSDAMKRAVSRLVRAYDRMIPECAQTQVFAELLILSRNSIVENEGSTVYEVMNVVYKYINAYRLVSDLDNKAESSDEEDSYDDCNETMETIRKQIQELQVMNLEN